MGWRIGFGIGPFRYSAPLTRRRQVTHRAVPAPPSQPLPSTRTQWIQGTLIALVIAAMCGGCLAWLNIKG